MACLPIPPPGHARGRDQIVPDTGQRTAASQSEPSSWPRGGMYGQSSLCALSRVDSQSHCSTWRRARPPFGDAAQAMRGRLVDQRPLAHPTPSPRAAGPYRHGPGSVPQNAPPFKSCASVASRSIMTVPLETNLANDQHCRRRPCSQRPPPSPFRTVTSPFNAAVPPDLSQNNNTACVSYLPPEAQSGLSSTASRMTRNPLSLP